jgi:outer membrane protein assembly factor BamB
MYLKNLYRLACINIWNYMMLQKNDHFRIIKIFILIGIFLSTFLITNGVSNSQENLSDVNIKSEKPTWPMFHYNAQRTGRCPYGPNITNACPELKWKLNTGELSISTPVISKDGMIYLGLMDFHKSLIAMNPNGTIKWFYDAGDYVDSSPAIGEDGTIYFGSEGDNLYALFPNGTLKWSTYLGEGWVDSSPAIDQYGIIYCTTVVSSQIHAVYPNGTIKWSFQTEGWVYSSPAIAEDGTVYVGSDDRYFYSISPNGTMNWRYRVGDSIQVTPAIGSDGTIYFGCWDWYLYALNPDGTLKWKVSTGNNIDESSPAIGSDGTIVIGSQSGKIVCVYPNGTIKWVYQTGDEVYSSPTIDKNGIIYCGSQDRYLYAINPNGTLRWKYYVNAEIWDSSPVIDANGTIYFANWGTYFYALNVIQNSIPTIPTITGESKGKIKQSYDYTIRSTDPESENISYYVDWGDGTNIGWIGPYPSGQEQTLNHTWNKKGTYTIKAKARDIYNQESDWGTLSVTMPYELPHFRFLEWLLELFPNAFPILRQFLAH